MFAQVNLVPNPSFEDTVSCPNYANQIDKAVGWHASRNTPDYFNGCDWLTSNQSVPNNFRGYQYAHWVLPMLELQLIRVTVIAIRN